MEEERITHIKIDRPLYEQEQLRQDFNYEKCQDSLKDKLCNSNNVKLKKCLVSAIPVLQWLPHYSWRNDFFNDLISGFTVAIMHIPQGMGYGMLGNVPPVVGIYMAFFPVLIYFFLGTSRHNSMGTFAVVCLMTGKAVIEHSNPIFFKKFPEGNSTNPVVQSLDTMYSPIEVATAVTFTVAIFQICMYFLQLGFVSALLSETLVSGFTTGAAVQVFTSQLKDILGIRIPKFKGYFQVINTYGSIFENIPKSNYAAIIISAVTILITLLNNEVLKPIVSKKSSFPVPIELIAIVLGTLISHYCNLEENYAIRVIGEIPSGIPAPTLPPLSLIGSVILDSFTIAIVSYTITMSMALIFAQKLNYEVDANQEFLAQGVGNLFGSFFSCMPFTASLSRSTIQQTVGGKTQIASLVSCGILVFVLLYIGPLFEQLPRAVLASVIVVALKGMLMQAKDFFRFWKFSKLDALVWMATFLTVVLVGIDIGLLVGLITSLSSIFILGFKPYTCLLGNVPRTDLYLDINRYKGTEQIKGIKIFHYSGGINFATRNIFRNEFFTLVGINPQKELIHRNKLKKLTEKVEDKEKQDMELCTKIDKLHMKINTELKCIIIDCSSISYVDPSGVSMLKSLTEAFEKISIPIYFSGLSDPSYELMNKCNLFDNKLLKCFATVNDAVQGVNKIKMSTIS